uniref:Ataxin-10 domain-containing protein n=1 Tax=Ditylum brightwellii TaxID=49249 RepID=A0A7S4WJ89_9STRA|mmetsp:Transcript_63261/g.93867  ORF Transcript_63261/g.93867 Transcript_63261/m.93867 type:complete len:718 (+) Transcript_63261:152-2305(+)
MISQELFDETLLENEEIFDLSPTAALQETMEEYTIRQKISISHLVLSHPNSTSGKNERLRRKQYNDWLSYLDTLIESDGSVVKQVKEVDGVIHALRGVRLCCRDGWSDEVDALSTIVSTHNEENDEEEEEEEEAKKEESNETKDPALPYLTLFHQSNAIYTFMSLLGIVILPSPDATEQDETTNTPTAVQILHETILTLIEILKPTSSNTTTTRDVKMTLRDKFVAFERLVGLLLHYANLSSVTKEDDDEKEVSNLQILIDVIRLATVSCRMCESNKVSFVRALKKKNRNGGGMDAIIQVLRLPTSTTNTFTQEQVTLWSETCQLITTLCKFDDFRSAEEKTASVASAHGINVSCAHDHVMEFFRVGIVPVLYDIISYSLQERSATTIEKGNDDENEEDIMDVKLAASAISATRVLAVNDEIVQCLVAVGILKSAKIALDAGLLENEKEKEEEKGDKREAVKIHLTSSSLGLLRNLCGNDEIKTTLCLGNTESSSSSSSFLSSSIVPSIIHAMKKYKNNPIVQEHGCGTFAAMALRKPKNALRILQDNDRDGGGANAICTCMKRFPNHVPLQRQACLAIRNIVSRLVKMNENDVVDDETTTMMEATTTTAADNLVNVREIFLDLGIEYILRHISGRHQGSVDEAYAALRDLGCQVSLVKFDKDDIANGGSGTGRTMMFGETKPKFRPVFEESDELNGGGGIEDRIAAVAESNGGGTF